MSASRNKTKELPTQRDMDVIFIVEDSTDRADSLAQIVFRETPYYTMVFADSASALRASQLICPVLFIFDYRSREGVERSFYEQIAEMKEIREIPMILLGVSHRLHKELASYQVIILAESLEEEGFIGTIEKAILNARIYGIKN